MAEEHNVVLALRASVSGPPTTVPVAPKSPSPPPAPRVPNAPEPPQTAAADAVPVGPARRQRFYVDLKPGETTIVSWKKLLRDVNRGERGAGDVGTAQGVSATAGGHLSLENRISPLPSDPIDQQQPPVDAEPKAAQPPHNRFSAVIEKIERLYMGKDSSDEEQLPLDDVPDDDQYDTEDSFIDDAELDEYFEVDKSATKHQGFFINRGKLERIERAPPSDQPPKKRRRKEAAGIPLEKAGEHKRDKVWAKGIARIKAAARIAPLAADKKPLLTSTTVHHGSQQNQDAKLVKNKSISSTGSIVKKRPESLAASANSAPTRAGTQDAAPTVSARSLERQKVAVSSRDFATKPKCTGKILDVRQEPSTRMKGVSAKEGSDTDPSLKIRGKQRNGNVELPDLNYPGTGVVYPTQAAGGDVQVKEATKPKGTMLERAIRELQKVAVLYQPPHLDNQDRDATLVTKKRLPGEVKQKLAKVARLANSQGKMTSEIFFGHLMDILGHLIQPNALKRHLKEMVAIGLTAKQENANRFQQIKKEVAEMVKIQISGSNPKMVEQQTGSSDDFQDPPDGRKNIFNMNEALEDKLYLLYELHVEGMEEDKGPQSRKLYVELAELWPVGCMDRLAIKDAISRAKARKVALYKKQKALQEEKLKRRRLSSSSGAEDSGRLSSQARMTPDRVSNATYAASNSGDIQGAKHQERLRASGSGGATTSDQPGKATAPIKRVSMKAEEDAGTTTHGTKLLSSLNQDKDKPSRTNESYHPRLSLHQPPSSAPQQPG